MKRNKKIIEKKSANSYYKYMKISLKKLLIIIIACIIAENAAYCDNCDKAEGLIRKAQAASNKEEGYEYLHQASNLYLEDCNENPLNIRAMLGMSKVWQMLGDRKEAKIYVLKAYNLNPNNPDLQKAMGDFFFNFQEYSTAIEYYKLSLASGNLKDFETNLQTAKCYEKLGDKGNSELYYKVSGHVNPSSRVVANKINQIDSAYIPDNTQELDNLKYKYLFKDKIETKEEQENKEIDEILEKLNSGNL